MPATVQLNTRIEPELKRRGDAVFARAGLSASEVVRAVWATAARTQEVPACAREDNGPRGDELLAAMREGAGLARRVAGAGGTRIGSASLEYESLRDEWYDEMSTRMAEDREAAGAGHEVAAG